MGKHDNSLKGERKMKLSDLINITPEQLKNMNERELDSAISFMRKSNQEALRRLKKSQLGSSAPAYRSSKGGRLFTKKQLDKEVARVVKQSKDYVHVLKEQKARLLVKRQQLTRLIEWRKNKTASVKGWKSVRDATAERLGMSTKRKKAERGGKKYMSKKFEKRFWKLEERFEDMHPAEVYNQGSPKLMEIVAGILEDHMDWDDEDILREAKNQLEEYKNAKRQVNKAKKQSRTSDIFDF